MWFEMRSEMHLAHHLFDSQVAVRVSHVASADTSVHTMGVVVTHLLIAVYYLPQKQVATGI